MNAMGMVQHSWAIMARKPLEMQAMTSTSRCLGAEETPHAVRRAHSTP